MERVCCRRRDELTLVDCLLGELVGCGGLVLYCYYQRRQSGAGFGWLITTENANKTTNEQSPRMAQVRLKVDKEVVERYCGWTEATMFQ